MGDRANVIVRDGNSTVYLYTHWAGAELPETVKKALTRAEDRYDDGPYLARNIFCEMIRGQGLDGTSGYGISSVYGDGGDSPDVVIDVAKQTVQIGKAAAQSIGDFLK